MRAVNNNHSTATFAFLYTIFPFLHTRSFDIFGSILRKSARWISQSYRTPVGQCAEFVAPRTA